MSDQPPTPAAPTPVEPRPPGKSRRLVGGLVAMALIAGIGFLVRSQTHKAPHGAGASPAGSASSSPEDRPVPVVTALVEKKDLPVYLEGLGNVTPIQTVLVKTQVDGRLDEVLFKEGQFVKKGERIAQIDPRPFAVALQQAQATASRDKAQLENAKRNYDRYVNLAKEAIVPEQQVDDQRALVSQLTGTIAADQAAVDSARLQLDFASIESPLDGVTGVRLVDPGNIVRASDTGGIVVITQLDPIAMLFTLPQDELPRVSSQMAQGPLQVEAFSRDGVTLLGTGIVKLIDNQIDAATATMKLKAEVANPEKHLWPNQFVRARLLVTTKKDALVVPATAVQRGPRGTFVYVVLPDNTAATKPIEVELLQGEQATIRGLEVGETVIIEGQTQLRPGSKLAPRPREKAEHGARP